MRLATTRRRRGTQGRRRVCIYIVCGWVCVAGVLLRCVSVGLARISHLPIEHRPVAGSHHPPWGGSGGLVLNLAQWRGEHRPVSVPVRACRGGHASSHLMIRPVSGGLGRRRLTYQLCHRRDVFWYVSRLHSYERRISWRDTATGRIAGWLPPSSRRIDACDHAD
jgi:hypothetical protein